VKKICGAWARFGGGTVSLCPLAQRRTVTGSTKDSVYLCIPTACTFYTSVGD